MSIEKIKQRIKMIEGNDFNITEVTYSSNLEPDEIDALKADDSTYKSVKAASDAASNAEKIARDTFRTVGLDSGSQNSSNDETNGNYIQLPSQFEKTVYPILALVKRYNISDDIAPNGKPIFGYSKPVFKNGRSNTLVLQKSQIVQVEFTDDKLSKLKSINVKKYKAVPASINAFYNDIYKNKNTYNVDSVSNTEKFIVIKFK
jgi:hypothetical protein